MGLLVGLGQGSQRRLAQYLRFGQVRSFLSNVGILDAGFVGRVICDLRLGQTDSEVELINTGANDALHLTEIDDGLGDGGDGSLRILDVRDIQVGGR